MASDESTTFYVDSTSQKSSDNTKRGTTISPRAAIRGQKAQQKQWSDVAPPRITVQVGPGVGGVVALSVWAAIDDPGRFAKSTTVGAYFGLTPRRYASGEIDRSGRISKCGDRDVRTHLYEAANVLLTRIRRPSDLQAWGLAVAKRSGFRKAKVAVARKLAVILHRMWRDATEFHWTRQMPQAA